MNRKAAARATRPVKGVLGSKLIAAAPGLAVELALEPELPVDEVGTVGLCWLYWQLVLPLMMPLLWSFVKSWHTLVELEV